MASYLFCLPRYHTNAVPWMRILTAAGHKPSVDVMALGPTENYELIQPVRHDSGRLSRFMGAIGIGKKRELQSFPGVRAYWRHMQTIDPDVVIVRGITRWFCRLAALFAVLQGRRLVIYDQEDVAPAKWSGTWLRRALLKRLGIPHFTSRVDLTREGEANAGRAVSLPFGSPLGEEETRAFATRPLAWPPRLLMVAKYRDRKGHALLLAALGKTAAKTPFTISFCGEEASDADTRFRNALENQAADLGISERVSFLKNIPHSQMADVYSGHDLFILPSRNEPAAVSPVEAAWAGCAVLISRDSGTRGYLPPGDEYHFDPESSDDMARAIRAILSGPEQLAHARAQCRAHLEDIGSSETILKKFESFIASKPR
ncbi:glycosyltransferase family 4 protein [Sphingopyxis sp. JAI128]|uniref:glycosyltransferase family 4 protein n=1 Tax=Sphingopyxis sp. JAI128 TaxID=2723066 RepID=UPI00160DD9F0|nr:glycosyltransferase family 4 protein [Sphingopyxis sp. JAI128]MBB6424397.1 glycosyltransferase involved in cell wall biosynthesis [Sphingopyxis sp. JAI128]